MPRPPVRTVGLYAPVFIELQKELIAFMSSLSNTDQLAFMNAIRSGTAFNFTPTS